MQEPKLLGVSEILKALNISRFTLYRWMQHGLPSLQAVPRSKRYFSYPQVIEWLSVRGSHAYPAIKKIRRVK